jgi:hypothetical protein
MMKTETRDEVLQIYDLDLDDLRPVTQYDLDAIHSTMGCKAMLEGVTRTILQERDLDKRKRMIEAVMKAIEQC